VIHSKHEIHAAQSLGPLAVSLKTNINSLTSNLETTFMSKEHHYNATIIWTGNKGLGTKNYKSYDRNHTISIDNKADILASSDAAFLGDNSKHNPEDLLVSSLSGCHMLWYLHLCSANGITVVDYKDNASGTMKETEDNGGHFTEVVLRPTVVIMDQTQIERANELHKEANKMCFIANSCNFPVRHIPTCIAQDGENPTHC
jgi:organic hydroperoxide reductase OsmC/OhrA